MPVLFSRRVVLTREYNRNHEPSGTADRNSDGRGDGGQFAKRDGPESGPAVPASGRLPKGLGFGARRDLIRRGDPRVAAPRSLTPPPAAQAIPGKTRPDGTPMRVAPTPGTFTPHPTKPGAFIKDGDASKTYRWSPDGTMWSPAEGRQRAKEWQARQAAQAAAKADRGMPHGPKELPHGVNSAKDLTRDEVMAAIPDPGTGPIPSFIRQQMHLAQEEDAAWFERSGGKDSKALHTAEDGRYTPERRRVHQQIYDKLFEGVESVKGQATIVVMGGLPGAGKTHSVLSRMDTAGKAILNADDIKAMLPEFNGNNANWVHEESSDIVKTALRIAAGANYNVVFDGTMSSVESVGKTLSEYAKNNYRVEARFVDVPVAHSYKSATARFYLDQVKAHDARRDILKNAGKAIHGGRLVPPDFILKASHPTYGSRPRATFEEMKPGFHAWEHVDGTTGKVVGSNGALSWGKATKALEASAGGRGVATRRRSGVPLLVPGLPASLRHTPPPPRPRWDRQY